MFVRVAIVAVGLFAAQALVVAAAALLRPRVNIYLTIIAVSIATTPLVVFADGLMFGRPLAGDGRVYLVLMHLALGGFLFQFMTLPDRSVTLRVLVELELA